MTRRLKIIGVGRGLGVLETPSQSITQETVSDSGGGFE